MADVDYFFRPKAELILRNLRRNISQVLALREISVVIFTDMNRRTAKIRS